VTLETLDSAGAVTAVADDIVTNKFTIKLDKLIEAGDHGVTSSSISVAVVDTTATITTVTPEANLKTSDPPIAGKFTLKCIDGNAVEHLSKELSPSDGDANHMNNLQSVKYFGDNIRLYSFVPDYHWKNGYEFIIDFIDLDEEPPLCTIQSGTDTPMTGATGLEFKSSWVQHWGKTLYWDVVPLEMLRTARTMP